MPFEKVETQVDFPAQEREIQLFWDRTQAFEKLREKNHNGKPWSFLDGPITANNPMGVHHAWGRTYKDAFQRYHAMLGRKLRYQNGFDCQGLWVEVEVEKELGLKSKRDIENLIPGDKEGSIDKFVQMCKDRVNKFARVQTNQSIRLGYWMDWDKEEDWAKPADERRSYFTMSEENNYTIWTFLKKCFDRGLIYRGSDVMPWSGRGGTAYSQMEVVEGRKLTVHAAPFVRMPIKGRDNEYLLVWTTTPWTLTSNVACAVNPQLEYVKVRAKKDGAAYWFAKANLEFQRQEKEFKEGFGKAEWSWPKHVPKLKPIAQIFKEQGGYEIEDTQLGSTLVGLEYIGPFDHLPAQNEPGGLPADPLLLDRCGVSCHRVIDGGRDIEGNPNVVAGEGTGIVHIAPGCGDIDHVMGKANGLVAIAPLDDEAKFYPSFGDFTGLDATERSTAEKVFAHLREKGMLLAVEEYPHIYPHCWRTGVELVFRPVDEWFIGMSWRQEIMDLVQKVNFLPESINGRARELDWLKNMGDWMISKKRFWGLALPIWVDDKDPTQFEVIGSREELKNRAVEGWDEFEGHSPHRPYIDKVKIRNPKTGNLMTRIKDVGNPWLDAGIVPYSTMGYNRDRAEWEKWFPADLITECFPGQFRNWFYAILSMSTMMSNRLPFNVLLGHALVRDQNGEEMHKSKGNSIPFEGAANDGYEIKNSKGVLEKHPPMGADLIRWIFCRTNPATNINFGPVTADEVRARFVLKLWNTYAFFCNYARLDKFDPNAPQVPLKDRPDIDRWILSDLQKLIAFARKSFENHDLAALCLEAERFIDDKVSNWYVRRNRRRFWKAEQGADKLAAYQTLHQVLLTFTKLLAPIMPFLAEKIYRNLVDAGDHSIHLEDYPTPDPKMIDEVLSEDMEALLHLVTLGSASRNTVKIKVRQPLAELRVLPGNDADRRAILRFADQLCEELNLKKASLHDASAGPLLVPEIKANAKNLGPRFGQRLKDVQQAILKADPLELLKKAQTGAPFQLVHGAETFNLEPADLFISLKAQEGWTGVADRDTQVALDTRITEVLALEGMARDIIRQVQDLRKKSGLEMEDRIILHLETPSELLGKSIAGHRDYIASETLVLNYSATAPTDAQVAQVKIETHELTITLKKA